MSMFINLLVVGMSVYSWCSIWWFLVYYMHWSRTTQCFFQAPPLPPPQVWNKLTH